MTKFEVTLLARIYLAWDLENYLNELPHDKAEEELINNLLERFDYETSFEMTFSDQEIKLLINALSHAIDKRPFVPEFTIT